MRRVTPPREQTLTAIEHSDLIHGRNVVRLGTDLHELADRIKNGDAVSGWEGDPRLTLAKYGSGRDEQFELWRLEHDGEYRMVAVLRPDAAGHLDPSNICRRLVERDARRGYDIKDAVDRHNARAQEANEAPSKDRLSGAAEKLAWALKRDLSGRSHWAFPMKVS